MVRNLNPQPYEKRNWAIRDFRRQRLSNAKPAWLIGMIRCPEAFPDTMPEAEQALGHGGA